MKAKDYAVMFENEKAKGCESMDALAVVLHAFTQEFSNLALKRGSQSEAAALACFKEIEQKYRAFARIISTGQTRVLPDGWRYYLEEIHPRIWELIKVLLMKEADQTKKILEKVGEK